MKHFVVILSVCIAMAWACGPASAETFVPHSGPSRPYVPPPKPKPEVERKVTLGPGNTPPGLYKPKPAPPKPEYRGTCMVLPCGQKAVPFVPAKH